MEERKRRLYLKKMKKEQEMKEGIGLLDKAIDVEFNDIEKVKNDIINAFSSMEIEQMLI
jgi:sporulation protein YlmC with PRC-barrel domain